jgi:hypothetical protein
MVNFGGVTMIRRRRLIGSNGVSCVYISSGEAWALEISKPSIELY